MLRDVGAGGSPSLRKKRGTQKGEAQSVRGSWQDPGGCQLPAPPTCSCLCGHGEGDFWLRVPG